MANGCLRDSPWDVTPAQSREDLQVKVLVSGSIPQQLGLVITLRVSGQLSGAGVGEEKHLTFHIQVSLSSWDMSHRVKDRFSLSKVRGWRLGRSHQLWPEAFLGTEMVSGLYLRLNKTYEIKVKGVCCGFPEELESSH